MSIASAPIAGIIAIEPLPLCAGAWSGEIDDSSLGSLLDSYAHCPTLAAADESGTAARPIVTSSRWRIASESAAGGSTLEADLVRLAAELEDEYRALRG